MKCTLRVVWLILIMAAAGRAAAQDTAIVSGSVVNSLTGDPVPNAIVVIESPRFNRPVRTGADGRFTVSNVPAGAYHLIVRADGYLQSRTELEVKPGQQVSDIRLNPELHFSEVTSVVGRRLLGPYGTAG